MQRIALIFRALRGDCMDIPGRIGKVHPHSLVQKLPVHPVHTCHRFRAEGCPSVVRLTPVNSRILTVPRPLQHIVTVAVVGAVSHAVPIIIITSRTDSIVPRFHRAAQRQVLRQTGEHLTVAA